jgi:hypothetical protein
MILPFQHAIVKSITISSPQRIDAYKGPFSRLTFLVLRRMGAPTFISIAPVATILSTKIGIHLLGSERTLSPRFCS